MSDSSVRCGKTYARPLCVVVADTCGTRICCSQDITASSECTCESQGQASYKRSARARDITMCQSHLQNPYTRSARTRIIVAVNTMPNPFLALAPGLCTRANSTSRNGSRHQFVPLYSIARAHAVVALDKNQ